MNVISICDSVAQMCEDLTGNYPLCYLVSLIVLLSLSSWLPALPKCVPPKSNYPYLPREFSLRPHPLCLFISQVWPGVWYSSRVPVVCPSYQYLLGLILARFSRCCFLLSHVGIKKCFVSGLFPLALVFTLHLGPPILKMYSSRSLKSRF